MLHTRHAENTLNYYHKNLKKLNATLSNRQPITLILCCLS